MNISVKLELLKRYKDSQTCSIYVYRMMMVQDFDVRWDHALLSASDMPSDVILEGFYKSKLQDSVQLQTVLALYDQETVRNNGQTSYLRLKTSVKLHVDQMMRTRNFRVRNEVAEIISHQESRRKESLRREESGRVFSVESTWTMFQRRLI